MNQVIQPFIYTHLCIFQGVAADIGIAPAKQDEVAEVLLKLYDMFLNKDASMVEINPFAEVNLLLLLRGD